MSASGRLRERRTNVMNEPAETEASTTIGGEARPSDPASRATKTPVTTATLGTGGGTVAPAFYAGGTAFARPVDTTRAAVAAAFGSLSAAVAALSATLATLGAAFAAIGARLFGGGSVDRRRFRGIGARRCGDRCQRGGNRPECAGL